MKSYVKEKRLFLYTMLVPAVGYILFWRIFPLLVTIGLSFTSFDLIRQPVPNLTGFTNYVALFLDSAFLHSLKLTFLTVVAVTAAEVLLGLGIALIFDRGIKASNLLLQIIVTPMMVAPVVVGLIWYILFHNIIGPINYALSLVGIQGPDWVNSTSTSLLSIAIADVWQWTPFTFLLLFSILRTVPLSMYEAARIDGASSFRIFWHVTLPMIKGMIWVTAILRSMDAFKMFDIIYVMTFGGPGNSTELVAIRIFKAAFLEYRFSYSAAMVIVLLAIISSLYLIYLKYADRESV